MPVSSDTTAWIEVDRSSESDVGLEISSSRSRSCCAPEALPGVGIGILLVYEAPILESSMI